MAGISRTVPQKSGNQNCSIFVYHSSALWATKERIVCGLGAAWPQSALILAQRWDFLLDSLRHPLPTVGVNAKCSATVGGRGWRQSQPGMNLLPSLCHLERWKGSLLRSISIPFPPGEPKASFPNSVLPPMVWSCELSLTFVCFLLQ